MELWKDIPGYEGLYWVSSLGNIKSRKREKLKPGCAKCGYLFVNLFISKYNIKHMDIHRIVAKVFVDNPHNYSQVNHKDGNKLNNQVDNLEWVTPRMNMQHAIDNGLRDDFGSKSKNSKLTEEQVQEIRKMDNEGTMSRREMSLKYGIHRDYITLITNRKRWKHLN